MALNINEENFVEIFDIKDAVVGQVGNGFVGKAVTALFEPFCNVLVHDKFQPGTETLEKVVTDSQVIFVAVPTPMKTTGECHTGIVEDVLQDIQNEAVRIGRDLEDFVVVMKSTVPPGFTTKMKERFALRIMFSPEFLTEANSVNDFKNARRILLGGDFADGQVVFKFFEAVWHDRLLEHYIDHPAGPVVIVLCDPEVAEMTKLFTNALLMTRVLFGNEIYQLCQKLEINYDEVVELARLDLRINGSHLKVPGPDGDFGAGGHCFPKDINNLRFVCKSLGVNEKLFTAVIERNNELRNKKDWEEMKGRAVIE